MARAELKELIESLPQATLAAKLRALMPAIDRRIKDGVRHQDIVDALNVHGGLAVPVKLKTFRCYLFRYRRKLAATRTEHGPAKLEAGARVDPVGLSPAIPRVRNASDLRRLREEEIDLEALARIGRDLAGR